MRVTAHFNAYLPCVIAVGTSAHCASLRPTLTRLNYTAPDAIPKIDRSARDDIPRTRIVVADADVPNVMEICALASDATKIAIVCAGAAGEVRRSFARSGAHAVVSRAHLDRELPEWIENFSVLDNAARAVILIVDDDELVAGFYGEKLKSAGFGVRWAGSASELSTALGDALFDLIIMDVHIPGMSGYEMTRMIRQDRRHIATPILFLSGDAALASRLLSIRDGGDDLLPKSLESGQLLDYVRRRVERARTLKALIDRDGLTGLLNHVRFRERLELEFERSRRRGSPLSVVLLDIDHFKRVNDDQGHQAGDMVIATLSRMLSAWLRRTDVVARYGGEEFVAILLDTDTQAAAAVADGFRRHVCDHVFHAPASSFSITVSGGVAGSSAARDASALIGAADAALYEAKRAGRNQIRRESRAALDLPLRTQRELPVSH